MGAAVLVAAVLAVLVIAHWGAVRDHVEAWHFQLTQETEMVEPLRVNEVHVTTGGMQLLATLSTRSVIFERSNRAYLDLLRSDGAPVEASLSFLLEVGYRVLEQRLPRKAYVIIYEDCGHTSHVSADGCRPGMPLYIDRSSQTESDFLELELETERFRSQNMGTER